METTDFGRRAGGFAALGTEIIGVSVDPSAGQKNDAGIGGSGFPLMADAGGKCSEQRGIKNERGMSSRVTYVVDKEAKIREIFPQVKVDGHTDEVLAAVRKL